MDDFHFFRGQPSIFFKMKRFFFRPKLVDCLKDYSTLQLAKDTAAGITVGVLALPLAMAFAIASGASPSAGIWTSIVAGFLISLFGGSKVQIGGPTGAFIPIVYGIITAQGYGDLLSATFLSGILLLLMGVGRLGQLIRFIPVAVVLGFTNGIAVVIFLAQVKDFFGLKIEQLPAEFFERMQVLIQHFPTVDIPTLGLAVFSLSFLILYPLLSRKVYFLKAIPAQLLILVIGTLLTALFALPVETIGSRFGGIPQEFPQFAVPPFSLNALGTLLSPAITLALLGAIESLLSARVADNQIEDKHDPNQELIAQGLANMAVPFFGGFAATGAIARTTTNVRAGGRTPVAGMIHALVLLLIVFVLAPWAAYVPLATLSAIVMMTAINMGLWRELSRLKRFPPAYRVILWSTFLVTVLFDLTVAVELGMVLACLYFIYSSSKITHIAPIDLSKTLPENLQHRVLGRALYGSLFFGATSMLEDALPTLPDVLILDMEHLLQIDTSGLEALQAFNRRLSVRRKTLILCNIHGQPRSFLRRSGFIAQLGAANAAADLPSALLRAQNLLK